MRAGSKIRKQGSVLLDTLLAVFVLGVGAAGYFSLLPQIDRMQRMAKERAIAMHIATIMIDELQMMHSGSITAGNLTALNLINPGQTVSPYSFTNIPLNNSTDFSPAQALKNGTGTLTVTQIDNGSELCEIEIDWTSDDNQAEKLVTGTIVGGYR